MFAGPLGRSTFTPPKSSFDSPLYGLVSLRRSQVAPAQPSAAAAKKKKALRRTAEGLPLHSFKTLLDALATRCQNACRVAGSEPSARFEQLTAATPLQQRALELLDL